MSTSILVAYATRYSSTQEVAETVATTLRESGLEVGILPLRQVHTIDQYRAVVIGAPLYMFRWHKDALRPQGNQILTPTLYLLNRHGLEM